MTPAADFERLAFEAALRGLDKQEQLLEELRARTGILLGASSLTAAFLGQEAFVDPNPAWLVVLALGAFVGTILASIFIFVPKKDLIFSESGSGLYEGLYELRNDLREVYRRLAYQLERTWDWNDAALARIFRAYRVAAYALVVEVLSLSSALTGTIF